MSIFIPKDRRSLFRQFLGGMYDAVVITDPNGHILDINTRATEHFGYELDELLDREISLLIPSLQPVVVQRIRKGLEGDRHVMINANGLNQAGDKFACEVTVSVIDLMNPGDLVFTIRNIEKRRAMINAFRSKVNAFNLSAAALFVSDASGRLTEANRAFCEMFDLKDESEVSSHVFSEFFPDAPLAEDFKRALSGETTMTRVVAEGDGDAREEVDVSLAPNLLGRRIEGVVGSVVKV